MGCGNFCIDQIMIKQSILTSELKKEIYSKFREYSLEETDFDGLEQEPVAFELFDNNKKLGIGVVQIFWGALHLKYLLVEKNLRGKIEVVPRNWAVRVKDKNW